jgi:hypothetical protein
MATTEEERQAHREYLEEQRHKHRLRAYHDEIQNLVHAIALLIKCTAFYIAARGIEVLWAALLKHNKFLKGVRD